MTGAADTGTVIAVERAERLHSAGVRWRPQAGDRFAIRRTALEGQVFTISDMVVEAHEHRSGTVLGFNGTTEWALDSVAQEDALWLPREDQLRELLGGTFRGLRRAGDPTAAGPGGYEVHVELPVLGEQRFTAATAADAYAEALLALVGVATTAEV